MSKVDITIQGRTFSLSCADGQEAHMQKLGTKLNARVAEISDAVGDLGELRLLVAAGISLLDELEEHKDSSDGINRADLEQRVTDLENSAAAAIRDAATRIGAIAKRVEGAI